MGGDGAGRHGLEVIRPRGEHPTYQGASLDIIGLVATNGINLPNCDAVKVGREFSSTNLPAAFFSQLSCNFASAGENFQEKLYVLIYQASI